MAEPLYGPATDPIEVVPVVVLSQIFPARPSSIPDIRDFVRRCLAESPLNEEGTREVGETVFRALLDAAGPTGSIQVAFRIFPEHVEVDVLHSDTQLTPFPARPQAVGGAGQAGSGAVQPAQAAAQGGSGSSQAGSGVGQPGSGVGQPGSGFGQPGSGFGQPGSGLGQPGSGQQTSPTAASGAPDSAQQFLAQAPGQQSPAQQVPAPATGQVSDPSGGGELPGTFADWMATALRREGMTQEAAAKQLGVSVKTVSRWVGGATEPRMRDLRRIQEVFGEVPLP